MKTTKLLFVCLSILTITACNNRNPGHSTPIDSSNVKGAPGATYGGDDPKMDPDSNRTNVNDTGTNAGNVHNNGNPDSKK
ncbi:MAG: hypothetical protein JSS82_11290 [Bacteroidetes bacterium]|nr:hypothetical protein [Bacteroidota bacterium]